MGRVEYPRKVLQGVQAPEMRAISACLDAIDSRLAAQDKVLVTQEKIAEARHNEILVRLEGLKSSFEIDRRIERLESRQPS